MWQTGIALVGISSLLARQGSATTEVSAEQMLWGMGLIVASQAVQAAQITFEDFFMADLNIAPLKIVGYEGLFGTIAMVAVMLPIVQFVPGEDGTGIHEDTIDTLHVSSPAKLVLVGNAWPVMPDLRRTPCTDLVQLFPHCFLPQVLVDCYLPWYNVQDDEGMQDDESAGAKLSNTSSGEYCHHCSLTLDCVCGCRWLAIHGSLQCCSSFR